MYTRYGVAAFTTDASFHLKEFNVVEVPDEATAWAMIERLRELMGANDNTAKLIFTCEKGDDLFTVGLQAVTEEIARLRPMVVSVWN